MFKTNLIPVKMRSRSEQAKSFWEKRFKPNLDDIRQQVQGIEMSVLFWIPQPKDNIIRHLINEAQKDIREMGIGVSVLDEEDIDRFKEMGKESHVIIALLLNPDFNIKELFNLDPEISGKLFLFIEEALEKQIKEDYPDRALKDIFKHSVSIHFPDDFREDRFHKEILYFLRAIRTTHYMQAVFEKKKKRLKSSMSVFGLYQYYKREVDVFQHSGHLFLVAFIRYLGCGAREMLLKHLVVQDSELDRVLEKLRDEGLIKSEIPEEGPAPEDGENSGEECFTLTSRGQIFFELFDFRLPILKEIQSKFVDHWLFALNKTVLLNYTLRENIERLNFLAKDLYEKLAREDQYLKDIRHFVSSYLFFILRKCEKAFLNDDYVKQLFEIWKENIAGVRRTWRPYEREQIEFIQHMFSLYQIAHDPKHNEVFQNYKDTVFSLSMLRPNTQAHIYLSYSFEQRPLKKFIGQYFRMAAITGQYDILLKRYPPYHNMLNLSVTHGERTFFDNMRGLDFRPITYRLDVKFTLALELNGVQTRQRERFLTCPILPDQEKEKRKQTEIEQVQKQLNTMFSSDPDRKSGDYLSEKIMFGEDGRIYLQRGKEEDPEPVEMYGIKRTNYIQQQDYLNFLKSIPAPGSGSGLILRFNLLDPIAVLMEGMSIESHIDLDEVLYVIRCLDRYEKAHQGFMREKRDFGSLGPKEREHRKPPVRPQMASIVEEVFSRPDTEGLKSDTLGLFDRIERIRSEEDSDQDARRYLISKLVEGKYKPLLQTICNRLTPEGFDLVFSLWPLLTGKELRMDAAGKAEEGKRITESETEMPVISFLKRELEDLLKNVFTKFLDISAATVRSRSEAQLAEMVLEHCLDVRSDRSAFKKRLSLHLEKHYKIHYKFLEEYLRVEKDETVIKNIYKMYKKESDELKEQIETDVEGISVLCDASRKRLYSPGINNRLLCFMDPGSVDVQIGEFKADGEPIALEEAFIQKKIDRQNELADIEREHAFNIQKSEADREMRIKEAEIAKDKRIREAEIEKEGQKKVMEFKRETLELERQKAVKESEEKIKIFEAERRKIRSEIEMAELQKLQEGRLDNSLVIGLVKAYIEKGIEEVERILANSPHILMTINPGAYELRENLQLRRSFLEKLDKNMSEIDAFTAAALLSKDPKEVLDSERYLQIIGAFMKTFQNFRFAAIPPMGHPMRQFMVGEEEEEKKSK